MSKNFSRLYILDGFNILRCGSVYQDRVGISPNFTDWEPSVFNSARDALISDVSMMLDKNSQAIIVYDGAANIHNTQGNKASCVDDFNRIKVVYSEYGTNADSVIERFCAQKKDAFNQIIVVTSDLSIQNTVQRQNVSSMSSTIFCDRVKYLNDIDRNYFNDKHLPYRGAKVKDVITKDVAHKLDSLKKDLLELY